MHEANSEERWKPTNFHNQIQLHNFSKKRTYQTPFAHSFHLLLGPASTGDRDPWHWVV